MRIHARVPLGLLAALSLAKVACASGGTHRAPPPTSDTGGTGDEGGSATPDANSGGTGGRMTAADAAPDRPPQSPPPDAAGEPDAAPPRLDVAEHRDLPPPDPTTPGPSTCPALTAGFTAYQPTHKVQFEGGDEFCTYRDEGGVELFRMMKNPAGVVQRCEARVANDYRAGVNQFEGDVRVTLGDATCVHQIFKFLMLNVYPKDGGTLTQHTGTFVTAPIFGRWLHVTTIHDVAAGKAEVYVDCVKKVTMNAGDAQGPNGWYNKYGLYGINGVTPRGDVSQVEWKNIRYYRKP